MSSTPPVLRSIDQLLGLADGGDYLPDLLDRMGVLTTLSART